MIWESPFSPSKRHRFLTDVGYLKLLTMFLDVFFLFFLFFGENCTECAAFFSALPHTIPQVQSGDVRGGRMMIDGPCVFFRKNQ